ncbi:hypothetical protein M422DRAFT_273912 [Sphaerobolus stellatus SS14]|uniref:Uncharacterized protein n=1 Tax=Sphaerobolus stellatus (strain SS14) TaxID=990650 RepID=A0A0C9UIR3_SPHS4|nr:hypothetical protein M422DRAFT_273912 [Sphaerobolus stellatus SS14]
MPFWTHSTLHPLEDSLSIIIPMVASAEKEEEVINEEESDDDMDDEDMGQVLQTATFDEEMDLLIYKMQNMISKLYHQQQFRDTRYLNDFKKETGRFFHY